ncbi:uncharacterized protein LOC124620097 [Schistocerca americana]|uniref:uncharacterized protein LOC124620097 n=1 Tax=Schistocerca americana TaxID=7009 RepID=UPI001F501700|nr:uncharacterized protein LOC124620097 [Schistocerca americana]
MTYEEFMALECPSGSEDELDFDDSDGDPTINVNDLESADSDSEPEATVVTTHNSNNYCLKDDENEAVADAQVPQASEKHQKVQINRIIWKKRSASFGNDKFIFKGKSSLPQSALQLSTPYQFLKYFFNDELMTKLLMKLNFTAHKKNPNKPFNRNVHDIHELTGICIISSLAPPTAVPDLWNDVIGVEVVKQTMSQRYFESLRATLHFNDNTKRPDPESQDHDKLHKIRPIIDHVNKKCLLIPMSERLSVDEQICATKARHHMKVYMKDKPHK